MQLIDPNHPVYRPLWVRILIVVVCFSWALMESTRGDPFWAVLAAGAGAYSIYMLLWNYRPPAPAEPAASVQPEPGASAQPEPGASIMPEQQDPGKDAE
jgi:hypothetical protein